ncbi:MAG TPA: hypothetical protein PLW65_20555 [Pseudomonadota bacterium]|nr:hypothetical protein [Pseudomonadota bacterium]
MTIAMDGRTFFDLSAEERSDFLAQLERARPELCFNGINCAAGTYGIAPMTGPALAASLRGEPPPDNLAELQSKADPGAFPLAADHDPTRIDQSGWAVIFAADSDPAVQEALKPLLDLRRAQAGDLFRSFTGKSGYRPGETKSQFCARHRISDGPAEPSELGYYVLIVGSPDTIPFGFQYQLDVMRGVGRLFFATAAEYASYARSVVEAESGQLQLARRAVFFGVANPDDTATKLSAQYLVQQVYEDLRKRPTFTRWVAEGDTKRAQKLAWSLESVIGELATKSRLGQLLGGADTPALLFTASHGAEFPAGDLRQLPHQGALVCQDWPGPSSWQGPVPQDFYFAGDDIASSARLQGLISFHFACFGGGTPKLDQFAQKARRSDRQLIAPQNFVARLPQRLLGHPSGGALAVIAHVERAWAYSFLSPAGVEQTTAFNRTLGQLLSGAPVGWATEPLNLRYADLATELTTVLEELSYDSKSKGAYELAALWTNHNDARGYAIFGDPAVRLPFAGDADEPRPIVGPELLPAVSSAAAPPAADTQSALPARKTPAQ